MLKYFFNKEHKIEINSIFIIQLLTSFIVGGIFVAFLSFLAEHTNERISGILLMLPSTAVLSFFFLGWVLSAEEVSNIIPAGFMSLGIAVFTSVIYLYLACWFDKFNISKLTKVFITLLSSTLMWIILSIPFAILRFESLYIGIMGYFTFMILAHMLVQKRQSNTKSPKLQYTLFQKIFRTIVIGFIISLVVFLGKVLNPFWGGIFAVFPAGVLSSLMFLHFYYETDKLFTFMKKAPMGSMSIFVHLFVVMVSFAYIGFIWGSVLALVISLLFSVLLFSVLLLILSNQY